jgi:hypothetical protein
MSAKKPLAGIKVLLLIIPFLFYFAPSFRILCIATCEGNNTIESDHFPVNSQNNCTDKLKCKAKNHSLCCLKAPQFSAALTTQSGHPQSLFNEISTTYCHAAIQLESFYVQEAEKFVTLDHFLYLSYQVFLI